MSELEGDDRVLELTAGKEGEADEMSVESEGHEELNFLLEEQLAAQLDAKNQLVELGLIAEKDADS